MNKKNINESVESRVCFEQLEDWVRERIQGWVQELLEEEVRELLGRGKSERRPAVDALPGYRNGSGKPRRLTMSCGTITVRRPRVGVRVAMERKTGVFGDHAVSVRDSSSGVDACHALPGRARR